RYCDVMFSGGHMTEFYIDLNDNDSFMCSSDNTIYDNPVHLCVCESCGYRTDFEHVSDSFSLKRKNYDLSITYDGYYVASLKLKETVQRKSLKGIEFIQLKEEPDFFVMFVRNVVCFDMEKRNSRRINLCSNCGNYESIVGATPAFLIEKLPSDICRSDVMFGSGNGKHPLLFSSQYFADIVEKEKLKGIKFEPVRT
ncbi:hypothetical protein, partial [Enterovibrio norvegicus]|uniref:hypothetical protein n=2 Tax=Enterovibrio norvegicus TaxID=188144 RepID=UPI000C85A33A